MDYEIPTFTFGREDDWKTRGACAELDPDEVDAIFFPARGGGGGRAARAMCAKCPVQQACLDHALDNPEQFGIWGGTSERERRVMKRKRALRKLAS